MIWSLVAAGNAADGAGDALTDRLATLLKEPEFGCDHSSLVIGPGPAAPLHIPGERVPEPSAV